MSKASPQHTSAAAWTQYPDVDPREIDASLLERARTLWQVGDWDALMSLDEQVLEKHPLRAKLSLLKATALHQLGRFDEASRQIKRAEAWGCPNEVLVRALMAGALNSLGRAHALRGRRQRATDSFGQALAIGFPGSEHRSTVQVRLDEQCAQLDLAPVQGQPSRREPPQALVPTHSHASDRSSVKQFEVLDWLLRQLDDGTRQLPATPDDERDLLLRAGLAVSQSLGKVGCTDLALLHIEAAACEFALAHVPGDYIPTKIARERQFYEREFLELLRHFHEPGTLVVDVGANIGNHTLYFALVMESEVVAFEPEPHNLACLELNIRLNGILDKVTVHRCALGSKPYEASLSMAIANNFGSFSTRAASHPHGNASSPSDPPAAVVPVRQLDEVLGGRHCGQQVGLLKVDVEGMELEVLQGAESCLRDHRPVVACECFNELEFAKVEGFLSPLGYMAVAIRNATPTFVFLNSSSTFHMKRLAHFLRTLALTEATSRKGFVAKLDD